MNKTRLILFIVVAVVVLAAGTMYISEIQSFVFSSIDFEENSISQDSLTGSQPKSDLRIEDITIGDGEEAISGDIVTVHYTGTLLSGEKFDSSLDRGEPFAFTLGANQVIKGWEQGIISMKVGGKRKLTIPPHLAYGDRETGSIPAQSTLVFEIELLAVVKPPTDF